MHRIFASGWPENFIRSFCLFALLLVGLPALAQNGLQFNGSTQYVTFGAATATLGTKTFTLEAWVKRAAGGVTKSTGTNGFDGLGGRPNGAYPVLTKGAGEAETPKNFNMNYFLGITIDGFIGVDFEDSTNGGNHPAWGVTVVPVGEWHHLAATYDGRFWNLYLDGVLDRTVDNGAIYIPEWRSIQHAALGAGLNSSGTTTGGGFFSGVIDEPRVWNVVRTQAQIQSTMNSTVTSGTGLLGRWGLDEGTGTGAANSVAGSPAGTLVNTPTWTTGAPPFQPANSAPTATGVSITGTPQVGQLLTGVYTYYDVNGDLQGTSTFRWLRNGSPIAGATAQTYTLAAADAQNTIVFEVTPVALSGVLTGSPVQSAGVMVDPRALSFGSGGAYVTFGIAPSLATPTFTVETWFKRTGTGVMNTTGTGGIDIIPLVAKGSPEAEASTVDENYVLGIQSGTNVLAADFEEGTGSTSPGLNHPLAGTTPITNNVWHHAAVTFASGVFTIYLDGNQEGSLSLPGRFPQGASIQHSSLGAMVNSTGTAVGRFDGVLDEVRIWNYGRSASEIQAAINQEITSAQTGLIACWSLDGNVLGSAGTAVNGTLTGSGYSWSAAAPFNIAPANSAPTATGVSITGTPLVGQMLTGVYAYNDVNGDLQGTSTFRWLRNGSPIAGATAQNYTLTAADALTTVVFEVTPVALSGTLTGSPVQSAGVTVDARALGFGSGNAYVTFGAAPSLNTPVFTLETWFRRDGAGTGVSTGTGGIPSAIPLITKGTSEVEDTTKDINYFFGIDAATGVLVADLERSPGSQNYPVSGVTPIVTGTWYHAAATYDGTTWRLYLNGSPEAALVIGPNLYPTVHTVSPVALGTSIQSNGTTTQGFFIGTMDETRIWNYSRSAAEIQGTINQEITSAQTGLIARWSLDGNVLGSAGTAVNGTLTGSGYSWSAAAPFNVSATPPSAPSGLAVTGVSAGQIDISWTDNSSNETGFEIELSTADASGPFAMVSTASANATSAAITSLTPSTGYWLRVRAANGTAKSGYSNVVNATTSATSNYALRFGSAGAYVTFGQAPSLNAPEFTVETWFMRTGTGVAYTSGANGVDMIPLVSKGAQETDGGTMDENYVLGIQAVTNLLAADFEEGTGSPSPGANHPVVGITPIANDVWHHAAATFAAGVFSLYLDGNLEATLSLPGIFPQGAGVTHASFGTMIQTNGTSVFGNFDGVIDEARIWNHARTVAEIKSTVNSQLTSAPVGLLARWGLNEGSGASVSSVGAPAVPGSIVGSGYSWVAGAPFNIGVANSAPNQPTLTAPALNATNVSVPPSLNVGVSDPDGGTLSVSYYGRPAGASGAKFTIVVLPDAQNYTAGLSGGTQAMFAAQTQWCVDNRTTRNIAYVTQVGDITNDNSAGQWANANAAMSLLDNFSPGIPFGLGLGNHDLVGGTSLYENYFPASRFNGRAYYGGHYGANNENHYELFSASGMDFVVVTLSAGDATPGAALLSWADGVLKTYSTRRAILVSHYVTETGNPAAFSAPGSAIYNALKGNPNLFLMLCGHVPGEGRRSDILNGNTIYSLLADYQGQTNGGNGYLRVMEFDPPNNVIHVTTYSPSANQSQTGASSQFDLAYPMQANQFQLIGTVTDVPSESGASLPWTGLNTGTAYEWYVTVSDGAQTVTGPTWSFTTGSAAPSARKLFLSTSAVDTTLRIAYPRAAWDGDYRGGTNDWGFTGNNPVSFYIVPEAGTSIGAADLTVRWDPAVLRLAGVDFAGSVFDPNGPSGLVATFNQLGTNDRVTIQAARVSPNNATIASGMHAGRIDFNVIAPGFSHIAVMSPDFRSFTTDLTDNHFAVSPHEGDVRMYLGDVASASGTAEGDGRLNINDLNLWAAAYWSGVDGYAPGMTGYMTKYDIGPTMTGYIFGRPAHFVGSVLTPGPDMKIDFEDLAIFSISYRLTGTPQMPKVAKGTIGPVAVRTGEPMTAGSETLIPLMIAGSVTDLRAASVTLEGTFGRFLGVRNGALLQSTQGPVFARARTDGEKVQVDMAVLGLDASGVNAAGELLVLRFDGPATAHVTAADCRTSQNRSMLLAASEQALTVPTSYALSQNYPNPFNPSTSIEYQVPAAGHVTIEIFTILGERIAVVVDEFREAGYHRVHWNGMNLRGQPSGSGTYFYRMRAGNFTTIRKMLLLK